MKFMQTILAFTAALTAEACVRVHTSVAVDPEGGVVLNAQVYDNGGLVCAGKVSCEKADSTTEWTINSSISTECRENFEITLRNYGREGTYIHYPYYQGEVVPQNGGQDTAESQSGTLHRYESCLTDNYANCGDFAVCKRNNFAEWAS